jgi:hypothetical protein
LRGDAASASKPLQWLIDSMMCSIDRRPLPQRGDHVALSISATRFE